MQLLTLREIAQVTATRCCVCNASLTDAESVEHGIGPTCSTRYYDPVHNPSSEQIQSALGFLASSELPSHILDGFLDQIVKHKAREANNILIYWASAHYDQRDEVFRCSQIMRALGYVTLADKLEIDRTTVSIKTKTDHLEAFVPQQTKFLITLRQIPGAHPLDPEQKQGHKVGWYIPMTEEHHLMAVLGVYFGGALMLTSREIVKIPHASWATVWAIRNPPPVQNPAPQGGNPNDDFYQELSEEPTVVSVRNLGDGWVGTHTPYSAKFVDDLKARIQSPYRRWDQINRRWLVLATQLPLLREIIAQHYGVQVK